MSKGIGGDFVLMMAAAFMYSNSQRLLKHTSSTFNKKAEIASIRELIK